ncbi:MAG: hypothetical protein ACI30S_10135 [Muribaculaceae bacterium]
MTPIFKHIIISIILCIAIQAFAQDDDLISKYNAFHNKAQTEYENFRYKANIEYAEFVKKSWQYFEVKQAIDKPKDDQVAPIIMTDNENDRKHESRPISTNPPIIVPKPQPQPQPIYPITPISPIHEDSSEQCVTFEYLNTKCFVRYGDDINFRIGDVNEFSIANTWVSLSNKSLNNLIIDCLKIREEMKLCDWAYLCMLDKMASSFLHNRDDATLLQAYIFCQSGYKMRLAMDDKQSLILLYATDNIVFGSPFLFLNNKKFYTYNHVDDTKLKVCNVPFNNERDMSLSIDTPPEVNYIPSEERVLKSKRYPDFTIKSNINTSLISFYDSYPTSQLENDAISRWAMYANTQLDSNVKQHIYSQIKPLIAGLSKKEAAEKLLNFVQTAFVYEFDENVWGCDRAFFSEETLFYPYCDCEDRSILFTRLVRDLLNLNCLLVFYPGHLATAIEFEDSVQGDYIKVGNRIFTIADPTYIGAPIGVTMPDMDNKTAEIVILY